MSRNSNLTPFAVAVEMVTYNHELYIEQAVESVMAQVTNFAFQLIICDDCSTDRTGIICKKMREKYPDKINLIINEKNLGVHENALQVHRISGASGAKYIAILEGDDYWSNTKKLQKQFDFLESHDDYSICFHQVHELQNQKLKASDLVLKNSTETYTIMDLAGGNFIHTPSVFFRNFFKGSLPKWFKYTPAGDYSLHMLTARKGKIKYFPESMSVYRIHAKSLWSSQDTRTTLTKWITVLELLLTDDFAEEVLLKLRQQKTKHINSLIELDIKNGRVEFKADLERFVLNDRMSTQYWLLDRFPSILNEYKDSMSYKVGRKITKAVKILTLRRGE